MVDVKEVGEKDAWHVGRNSNPVLMQKTVVFHGFLRVWASKKTQ